MRKIIALILALICVMSVFVGCNGNKGLADPKLTANGSGTVGDGDTDPPSHSPEEEFEFEAGENGLTVTKYLGSSKKIVIPSVVNNKKVVDINADVFGGNIVVEEIVLSEYMKKLYLSSFKGCDNLKSITYSGVTSLSDYAWVDYLNYADNLPENLTTMIFPALKTLDVRHFSNIISFAPQVTTYICKNATELVEQSSFTEECINLVIPEALIDSIKSRTVNVFGVYEYEDDYYENKYVLKESYTEWIFENNLYQYWKNKCSIIDKTEVREVYVEYIDNLIASFKQDGTTDVEHYYCGTTESYDFQVVIRWKDSDGECGYRLRDFEVDGYFDYDDDEYYDYTYPRSYTYYEYIKSVTDPNCAVATAFGVYSITINGVTYSYEHTIDADKYN